MRAMREYFINPQPISKRVLAECAHFIVRPESIHRASLVLQFFMLPPYPKTDEIILKFLQIY